MDCFSKTERRRHELQLDNITMEYEGQLQTHLAAKREQTDILLY